MKEKLRNLQKGVYFIYCKQRYQFLGSTNLGMICTYRFEDDKYVIFDVDAVVEMEQKDG